MWLPDEVKKCVAFICIESKQGNIVPCGTGFFVSIPSDKDPLTGVYIYLVTALHVAVAINNRKFWISINNKDGVAIKLVGAEGMKWTYHPQHSENPADIAIMSFPINETYDVKILPIAMILNEELVKNGDIGIGNEVFITGLFRHFSGREKNIPIVRMGNIAMLPDERVPTKDFGDIDAYLIEARSIGGISGSPVFFCKEQTIKGATCFGPQEIYLGGLIHGHWDIPKDSLIDSSIIINEDLDNETQSINLGIAIVTPAKKILETLYSDDLVAARKKFDKER